jgi:AcrR family transcriptional regulator
MKSRSRNHPIGTERHTRILTAAFEVFSKGSFWDATTEEIARRARVSKRDIYALFPDKHAILTAVIGMVLEAGDDNLRRAIADSDEGRVAQREKLEVIGLAVMSEILSPVTGFVSRLAASESIKCPAVGTVYFDNWYTSRSKQIAEIFSRVLAQKKSRKRDSCDPSQASQHFVALIAHLPQLTAAVGMGTAWTPKSVQSHVRNAVDCFLSAYPCLA